MNRKQWFVRLAIPIALCAAVAAGCSQVDEIQPAVSDRELTALDRYVATPDPDYSYSLHSTIDGEGFTGYVLGMTSQSWLTPDKVDRPLWKHWLTVVVPDAVEHATGMLHIAGGSNDDDAPTEVRSALSDIAVTTRSVVAELRMVPNQPLTFVIDDTEPRWEDSMIAYAWDKYLRGGDVTWLPRLPMTKSAVRAMDTVTSFCAETLDTAPPISRFVVAGASKRGWTAWTTAAVDDRVVAVVPFVIDMLNFIASFEHHWEAYGMWAPALGDYTNMGIMNWHGHPRYDRLLSIVDPYSYRDRYTMPKLIINSAGDPYFLPDSSRFYFDDLPDRKFLRYVPNTGHGLGESDATDTMKAFYAAVLTGTPLPRFSWAMQPNGTIRVETTDRPRDVVLWQATNFDARDFRKESIGKAWISSKLEEREPGVYIAEMPEPSRGWTAFFVELVYDSSVEALLKLTTGVRVVPETMPFTYVRPQNPGPLE